MLDFSAVIFDQPTHTYRIGSQSLKLKQNGQRET